MAEEVGVAYVRLIPSMRGFSASARSQLGGQLTGPARSAGSSAGAEASAAFTSRFGAGMSSARSRLGAAFSAVGAAAMRGVAMVGTAAVALGAAGATIGLKTAASLEQAQVAFTTLIGSGTKAQAFLTQLKAFAARTPFELPGVIDAARQLLGVGVAAKDVIPIMTALGNASGALGLSQEQFSRVMLAVTQIMSKGKIQAEEVLQVTEAGIPMWQLLAQATGKPIPALQKLASEGKLLAADVLPKLFTAMNQRYGGAMEAQSRTLAGVWSTFTDTVKMGLATALQPLIPVLKTALPAAASVLSGAFQGLASGIATVIGWFSSAGVVFATFRGQLSPTSATAAEAGRNMGALSARAAEANTPFNAARVALAGFLQPLRPIINAVTELGQKIIAVVMPGFRGIWSTVQTQLLPAIKAILPVIAPVAAFLIRTIGSGIVLAFKGAFQVIRGVLTAISGILNIFAGLFTGNWSRLWNGVKQLVSGIWNAILGAAKIWLGVGMGRVFAWGGRLLSGIWSRLWSGAASWFSQVTSRILGGLISWAGSVIGRVRGLASGIVNVFAGAGRWLVGAGRAIVDGLKNGISAVMAGIWNWIRDHVVNPVINAVKRFFGIKSPSTIFAGIGRNLIAGLLRGLATTSPIAIIKRIFGSMPAALAAIVNKGLVALTALPGKALSALANLGGKAWGWLTGLFSGGGGSPNANALLAQRMAAAVGWTGAQWQALYALGMGESGWRTNALNPSSGAYGIPQALPAGKMASAGADWRTNPATQIRWMLQYIRDRYGSPIGAYSAWLSRSPHWYDAGGIASGAGYLAKRTLRPERVLSPRQTAAFERLVGALDRPAPAAAPTVVINAAGLDRALLEWLRRTIRVGGGNVQTVLGR